MDCEPVRVEVNKRIPREEKEKNMNRLVLAHCVDGTEHLSFLSGSHMSPTDSIPLPFHSDDEIRGNSCRGLFYFSSLFGSGFEDGKVVICNLTTKKIKLLTPPSPDAFYCDDGLGYDSVSDDYKVIRNHNPATTTELYSLKSDSWKEISGPGDDVSMDPESGVYINECCYWVVVANITGYGVKDFILSFDFRTETFSRITLPPPLRPPVEPPLLLGQYDSNFNVNVFDCDGFLGVVGRKRLPDHKSRVARHFELWVYRGGSWERSFSVILLDVERPLGLNENRFLFLEGINSCGHRHLMVYDWVKEELREHALYVKPPNRLILLSYVENTVELPNAKPLIDRYFSKCSRLVKQNWRQFARNDAEKMHPSSSQDVETRLAAELRFNGGPGGVRVVRSHGASDSKGPPSLRAYI
ncbi:hypothetical protein OROGR_021192 [Orobanche gracilis]